MKTIEITQNFNVLVDDVDFDFLNQFTWCYSCGYAQTKSRGHSEYMHQMVAERKYGRPIKLVDHKNANTLDNRRDNVRESSKSLNALNNKAKGWTITPTGRFRAQLLVGGVRVLDKVFDTEEAAKSAYREAKEKHEPKNPS